MSCIPCPHYPSELVITSRLVLRRHARSHAPLIFSAIARNREELSRYLPWVQLIKKEEDEALYLRSSSRNWEERRRFDFGLFDGTSGEFFGCISVHAIRWDSRSCEIGFWLTPQSRGRGFASEALNAIEEEIHRRGFCWSEIRCHLTNTRSAAVADRNGYSLISAGAETAVWRKSLDAQRADGRAERKKGEENLKLST